MTTEKGTARPQARLTSRKRGRAGSMTRRKKSALRRAVRSLNSAGFTVGRKLVIAENERTIAIAFPNYIRAQRDQFRRPGEASLGALFAMIAYAFAENAILKG